ncbi:hypothetical protein FE257_005014 [Aspergillus nanangensis]|uniref:Uncharacterized protein n=1 Tax=Aspergillus nanangensis TaxID=2582783 RepID=A0AAD4CQX8_ASPNN|nr:hypothetical protein FE257_005014 [Aspergillus nanangensis]
MTTLASRVRQFGLTQVYSSPDPKVDIVLVHGLNGHPYKTWATKSDSEDGVYWPAHLLPEVLDSSRVRILAYGYNANVSSFTGGVSNDRLLNHAETLASGLAANRNLRSCQNRPIIFVCHSLGGLVVKRTLIYCNNIRSERTEHLRSIYVSTYGILFLGTPHNGSDMAKWGHLLQNICTALMPKKLMESSSNLVKTLKTNNENLQNINSLFVEIMGRFHIYYFHETLATDVKGGREMIVDESSAAPQAEGVERMGIEADHRHMCKFEDDASPGYEAVAEALLRYSREAPDLIARRWLDENEERKRKRIAKAEELFDMSKSDPGEPLGGSTPNLPSSGRTHLLSSSASPASSITLASYEIEEPPEPAFVRQPLQLNPPVQESRTAPGSDTEGNYDSSSHLTQRLLIAPPGFHPNSTFYGMKKEIETLHNRLFKSRKRPNHVRAVLISGVPGSGKSHLARQYVWTYRDCYPGGIFWIDAKSSESIFKCFWDIAQAALLTNGPEFQLPSSERSQKFVEEVRNWFQTLDGWLLIFDGIAFSHEEDINNFKQFLPFKEKCSIIYTSVDSTLRRKQRLFEPYCIQIPPLQVEDACKLLFKDLGIRSPNPQQIRKATALVKHYECLPLAIHAMSHHLSIIRKPIEKYQIDSHLTDKKVAEPFLRIMNDLYQMGHFEALNLINLLSFFGHHVPVGLIMLGRIALEAWSVEILTSSGPGERGDLDTTLGILIRYGLIERSSDAYALQAAIVSPRSEKESILDMKAVAPDLSESQTESSQEAFFSLYQNSGSIDFIKIHSVVQGFCRDELKIMDDEPGQKTFTANPSNAGFYVSWLAVATRVFCKSYENARKRMGLPDDYGLVKDYREYETHASRLAELFPKRTNNEPEMVRDIREELKQVRKSISNEIERISPSSSQESIRKHRSVFDRSSSSSSSVPDSVENGPSRHTTWDETEPEVESPQEMPKAPHNLSLKPFLPHIFREPTIEKDGYETDGETEKAFHRTSPALSQMSSTTERTISSQASTPSQSTDEQGWHVVPPRMKPKPSRPRQIRGRPRFPRGIRRPKPAAPILKVETAQGKSASSGGTRGRKSSVSASEALIKVHNASPHQSQSHILKGPWFQPSVKKENVPTYATVVAKSLGETASPLKPRSASSPGGRARPTYLGLRTKASGESLLSCSTNMPGSPELRPNRLVESAYNEPDQVFLTQELNALDLRTSLDPRYHTRHPSTIRQMAPVSMMDMSASTPLLPPLPYDSNIDVSYARPRPSGTTRPTTLSQATTNMSVISHPSAIMPGASSPPSVTAEPPLGYTSDPAPEPMTRGPSGQSHQSWSTEPVRYPPKMSPIPPACQPLGPVGTAPAISQQQVLSGTGSWAGELQTHHPSQKMAPVFQADVAYASHLRPQGSLEEELAVVGSRWDPESSQTLHFGGHRVDVRDARQRLVGYRAYEMGLSPPAMPPYSVYHSNLSGPLIHHEGPIQQSQEPQQLRPRSGSSPTHPGFSYARL